MRLCYAVDPLDKLQTMQDPYTCQYLEQERVTTKSRPARISTSLSPTRSPRRNRHRHPRRHQVLLLPRRSQHRLSRRPSRSRPRQPALRRDVESVTEPQRAVRAATIAARRAERNGAVDAVSLPTVPGVEIPVRLCRPAARRCGWHRKAAHQPGWRGGGASARTSGCSSSAAVAAELFVLLARFDQLAGHVPHQDCWVMDNEALDGVENASVADGASMLIAGFADTSQNTKKI